MATISEAHIKASAKIAQLRSDYAKASEDFHSTADSAPDLISKFNRARELAQELSELQLFNNERRQTMKALQQ